MRRAGVSESERVIEGVDYMRAEISDAPGQGG